MGTESQEMTFWDHLDELRGTLIRSLLAVFVMTLLCLAFGNVLFDGIILAPTRPDFVSYRWMHFVPDIRIVNLDISGQFVIHLRSSLMCGLVLSFPFLVLQIWKFIAPALYPKEKKSIAKAFGLSSLLFYAGVFVGYIVLLPVCLGFFQSYTVSDSITNSFSLQSYMSMFGSMVLMIGIVFEFPVLILILSNLGILSRTTLKKGRKYAVLVIMILSALITPADIGSMIIVSIPMYALYELSILFCRDFD